jgi:hypothetical protein
MVHALGVDPKNFFDFKRDWLFFQEGKVRQFLAVWLEKELDNALRSLESAPPADIGRLQGAALQIRKMKTLVDKKFCDEPLKEILAYLDSKERYNYGY